MEWVCGVWRAAWFAWCVRSQVVGIAASRRVAFVVSSCRGATPNTKRKLTVDAPGSITLLGTLLRTVEYQVMLTLYEANFL